MNLNQYDKVIVNSSGGKDSACALFAVVELARRQGYPLNNIVCSHQDLGFMEWPGTLDVVINQCAQYGIPYYVSKRRDKNGNPENLLEYVSRRGKWPSNKQRYCTSDFKRGPGNRVVTMLSKDFPRPHKFLQVFGFRKEESPSRAKKEILTRNASLTTQTRTVDDWLPIHHWPVSLVWSTIRNNDIPTHYAYKLGMPRLSCCFCIFSPFDALVIAGKHNSELLNKYVEVEQKIGHSFRDGFKIESVRDAIEKNYIPKNITDWVM